MPCTCEPWPDKNHVTYDKRMHPIADKVRELEDSLHNLKSLDDDYEELDALAKEILYSFQEAREGSNIVIPNKLRTALNKLVKYYE